MEILYVLIPISLLLLGLVAVILFWAVRSGQFEDLEGPAHRILMDEDDVPRQSAQGHRRQRAMDE